MKDKKGFTILDVILILIMVAVMAGAGMSFYDTLQKRNQEVEQQITAINLATAQVEDLLAIVDYNDTNLIAGHPAFTINAADIPNGFGVSYAIGADDTSCPPMTYKPITVTVTYPPSRTLTLTGYKVQ